MSSFSHQVVKTNSSTFKKFLLIGLLGGGIVAVSCFFVLQDSPNEEPPGVAAMTGPEYPPETEESEHAGPEGQRRFFAEWHEPFGAVLSNELQSAMWTDVHQLKSEDSSKTDAIWTLIGPHGMTNSGGGRYSGRVLDLEALDGPSLTIASASGGLWRYNGSTPAPLADDITSQWISSVAYDPYYQNVITVGTGEWNIHGGTGIWKSYDNGQTWQHKSLSPEPTVIFRIAYSAEGNICHAATSYGYYRSADRGETWTRILSGAISDLVVSSTGPGIDDEIIYLTRFNTSGSYYNGLYKSLDQGQNWSAIYGAGSGSTENRRGAISVCREYPEVIYTAFSCIIHPPTGGTYEGLKGVYKSTDFGDTWTNVSPSFNYMGKQGWYNNVIQVCPTIPNLVFVGGVNLLRSTNGGSSWEVQSDPHLHADYHAMQWRNNSSEFWVGHDGGWSYSSAWGNPGSWSSATNTLPITQFTEFDAGGISLSWAAYCGGSQDNGICTSQGGSSWVQRFGGDGGGVEFGSGSSDIWFRWGYFDDGLDFRAFRSQDGGVTSVDISAGIPDSGTWYPTVCRDAAGTMYTLSGNDVFSRSDADLQWNSETSGDGLPYDVWDIAVCPISGQDIIWVCLNTTEDSKVSVKRGSVWYQWCGSDLPADCKIRKIVPHPTNPHKAYAVANGLGNPGEKLFVTHDYGWHWENISGNLPDVPMADVIVHPDNDDVMYVGTGGYGFLRTMNGGVDWERWNTGIPEALMVTEMKTIDMRGFNHGFHIIAGTFGRGLYRREVAADGTSNVAQNAPQMRLISEVDAFPNPFNAQTTLHFNLEKDTDVQIAILDIAGRRIRMLTTGRLTAGAQTFDWDGCDASGAAVASGTYLATISAERSTVTQKVVLAK